MGRQKLLAKQAELEKKQKTAEVFTNAVSSVNALTEKIRLEQEKLSSAWSSQINVLSKLDTGGDAKLEEIRKKLLDVLGHEESTTPVVAGLKTYMTGLKSNTDKEMNEWIKKSLANIPPVITVGMLLKSYTFETVFEVTEVTKGNNGDWAKTKGISGKRTGTQLSFPVSDFRAPGKFKLVKLA